MLVCPNKDVEEQALRAVRRVYPEVAGVMVVAAEEVTG